ncbi:DUF1345 domain-containing protein [Lacisediminimonas profundi]|uniref:DUF1345 domain-containing protein n=1 Tax=Lacisediminimonas profundi TaxID=2603856 RepID=UPI00124B5829|nr:DUF1345 domain-containing protein [Lacisediminimonas profundi]
MDSIRRFAHHRPRLAISIVVGMGAGLLLTTLQNPIERLLAGWNVGVWAYLVSLAWLVVRANPDEVRVIAAQEDNSARMVLVILSLAAVLSVAAIAFELTGTRHLSLADRLGHYAFTAVTLVGSWLMLGMVFTIHYAHLFYRADHRHRPLMFPGGREQPDYWDFLYFSFTIAVAAQTSDVIVLSHTLRRLVLAQSVLSFLFNAAILGLSVNIAAGLLGQ